jgi:hypothetical protein
MTFYIPKAGYYDLVEVTQGTIPPEVTVPNPTPVTPPPQELPPSVGDPNAGISVNVPGEVAAWARIYVKNLNESTNGGVGQKILDYCGGNYTKFNQIVNAFSAGGGNT